MFCKCNQPRKCYPLKDWRVIRYQYTPHGYSRVKCLKCGCVWVGHNIYFDTSIVKAMILRIMGREYYDAKAEDALFKGKRIDTMMKTIKFVGALYADGRPGKYPKLEELYNKCFPGETFPAHDALEDVKACKRCIPVLVENGIIELKPKEYPAEQLKFNPEPEPIFAPDAEPENKVAKLLNETDF